MRRFLLLATAALALSACESSSSPTGPLAPTTATRDLDQPPPDAVPDPSCRSGWSVANGRCW